MTHDTIGYYWDGCNSFIIKGDESGNTELIKEKETYYTQLKKMDAQVEKIRKMQKEIYG